MLRGSALSLVLGLLLLGCATGGGDDAGPGGQRDAGPDVGVDGGGGDDGGPSCGDGTVDEGEECDDGNDVSTDECLPSCRMARCGDAVVWEGVEECDDGNGVNDDACPNDCVAAGCGNGRVDAGEECDDGNADDTDACPSSCLNAACGDGFVQAGVEACDDGNTMDTDACVGMCVTATCGDGFVQAGVETCDDGNMVDTDGCTNACEGWRFRVPISFTATAAGTNVPILVVLDGASFTYANAAADGSDLRFGTDDDPGNGFEAPHWTESWDATGTSYVWVNVPAVTAGSNTLWAFYGYSGGAIADAGDFAMAFPNALRTTGDVTLGGAQTRDAVVIEAGHTLTVMGGAPLSIDAAYVRIDGSIDADGAGHASGAGPGTGGMSTDAGGGGAGYGGTGGRGGLDSGDSPGAGGAPYGALTSQSIEMGSGGGPTNASTTAGAGGGAVRIDAQRAVIAGTVTALGLPGVGSSRSSGGGSGGGVMIRAASLVFTGTIRVDGGAGGSGTISANDGGGGGAGGRVKLFHGPDVVSSGAHTEAGGAGGLFGGESNGLPGSAGSFHVGTGTTPTLPAIGAEQTI